MVLLDDVDAFCAELRPIEELCYLEHRQNEQLVPLAKKYNLLGMPVPTEYGGGGVLAKVRFQEGELGGGERVGAAVVEDSLWQRCAEAEVSALDCRRRADHGLWADRARGREQPA